MGNLNETPSANRLHIGIYGKTNSGKSSLINAVTKQEVSIVADVAGTTTDPVYKPVSYTHLDVYKRQALWSDGFKGSAQYRFHGRQYHRNAWLCVHLSG